MTDPVAARPAKAPPAILELFRRAERVLVFTHHNPDGDALGSAVGLVRALLAQGRTAALHLRGTWSEHLGFLLEGLPLIEAGADFPDADLLVLLTDQDGLFDRARGRMVGSDQYLTKPFTKDSLLQTVAAFAMPAETAANS